jgi:hypothetical protein
MGNHPKLLEPPTVEISQDGLTYTKTFILADDFDTGEIMNEEYMTASMAYQDENNIEKIITNEII